MANKTAWAGGSLAGGGAFTPAFNASDLNSLANLSSVLGGITFDNTVATLGTPDQWMDISFVGQITPSLSTIGQGAGIAFFLWCLQLDNATYGDGRLTAGTQVASTTYVPLLNSIGGFPISPGTGITNIAGSVLEIPIPPRKFALTMQNQSGWAFAAGGVCACSISTYRQQTNA
jgi:hypothetical protein